MLPRGEILRGGDLVTASDGRVIEVVAEPGARDGGGRDAWDAV